MVEHLQDDKRVIERMWKLVKSGGCLILSMPCLSKIAEEYHDVDPYGLQTSDDGWFFFQRYYDANMLQDRIFSSIGTPVDFSLYGEKVHGSLKASLQRRRSDPSYPYWREPWMMAREWRRYDRIKELPGEGVIMMLFQKRTH